MPSLADKIAKIDQDRRQIEDQFNNELMQGLTQYHAMKTKEETDALNESRRITERETTTTDTGSVTFGRNAKGEVVNKLTEIDERSKKRSGFLPTGEQINYTETFDGKFLDLAGNEIDADTVKGFSATKPQGELVYYDKNTGEKVSLTVDQNGVAKNRQGEVVDINEYSESETIKHFSETVPWTSKQKSDYGVIQSEKTMQRKRERELDKIIVSLSTSNETFVDDKGYEITRAEQMVKLEEAVAEINRANTQIAEMESSFYGKMNMGKEVDNTADTVDAGNVEKSIASKFIEKDWTGDEVRRDKLYAKLMSDPNVTKEEKEELMAKMGIKEKKQTEVGSDQLQTDKDMTVDEEDVDTTNERKWLKENVKPPAVLYKKGDPDYDLKKKVYAKADSLLLKIDILNGDITKAKDYISDAEEGENIYKKTQIDKKKAKIKKLENKLKKAISDYDKKVEYFKGKN